MILCHACGAVFIGGFRESQDHALDEHRDTFGEGDIWFTDLLSRPDALLEPS